MPQGLGLQVSQGMKAETGDSCALLCRSGKTRQCCSSSCAPPTCQATVSPSLVSSMQEPKTADGARWTPVLL